MSSVTMAEPAQDLDFLSIERFIGNLVEAQALKTAFDLGLIDRLKQQASCTLSNIKEGWRGDRPGLSLLIDLLAANQVVARSGDEIRLTRLFVDALRFRDLLEAKLEFASLVRAPTWSTCFPRDRRPGRFHARSPHL